jgi:hypothetical protein
LKTEKNKEGFKMAKLKETKELVSFVCALANSIGKISANGKPALRDIMHLVPLIHKLPTAMDGIADIPQEIKAMSEADVVALVQSIKDDLDLPQDKIEAAIEDSLDVAVKLYSLAQKLRV